MMRSSMALHLTLPSPPPRTTASDVDEHNEAAYWQLLPGRPSARVAKKIYIGWLVLSVYIERDLLLLRPCGEKGAEATAVCE